MSDGCRCCGGRCGDGKEQPKINRREFLEQLAAGAAAMAVAGELTWAQGAGAEKPGVAPGGAAGAAAPATGAGGQASAGQAGLPQYAITPARVYKDKFLEAVAMPIGGIGTGSIWLDGQGRLAVWQIFNNLNETRIPDSFFAVAARAAGGEPVVRVLQTVEERGLKPVASLEYEGGYPIARLTFRDAALPVEVLLEAFNPMVPLDAASSSIPCAIFRLTARNTGKAAAEVAFLAALQNAVGSKGGGGIQGVRFGGYGGNRNTVLRDKGPLGGPGGLLAVTMDKSPDPVGTGPVKVRTADGRDAGAAAGAAPAAVPAGGEQALGASGQKGDAAPAPELYWLAGAPGLAGLPAEQMARTVADGGAVVADGVSAAFFKTLASLRSGRGDGAEMVTVFEDFEKPNYEGWTITGDAFGKKPARGTADTQQPVGGFAGHGLVNTYANGGDGPQGTATSKAFRIERKYIGFLIGGGAHKEQTCMNLRVDGKVVRTATGKDRELLEPASWDVTDLKGKEATIEIVDKSSTGWGHINVDQIVFADVPPEGFLQKGTAADTVAKALALAFTEAQDATLADGQAVSLTDQAPAGLKAAAAAGAWKVTKYVKLAGFKAGEGGFQVLAATSGGDPLLIQGPLGKGRVILALAAGLPWTWGSALLAAARGEPLKEGERLVPGDTGWGTMALAALDAGEAAVALPAWASAEELAAFLADPAKAKAAPAGQAAPSKQGETINAALAVPMTIPAGESKTATFAITWHFPNVQRFQHAGNLYSRRWADAAAVARQVAADQAALWSKTRLYHQTLYQSNLPEEFLDAMTSQVAILRGPTCWWSEDGYFAGFEGSYGCCPLNCTHVWNYAQTHARLFPEVGRNMRISNFVTFLHPTGETSHREHAPHGAFTDGHCACIEAALREHQLSPDGRFLATVWPGVKKAVDWLIQAVDKDHDGVPSGQQLNTYDTAVSGANTFIGSQYLSALAAGERLATVMGDAESAARWRVVREAGMKNQNEKLWSGEYYIQVPEAQVGRDYGPGCHADQLLGQWWAHMLNLGYLYPPDRVKGALAAVAKYNIREKFAGFKQDPRRYVPDDEGGLIICTWPHAGRPKSFILYADEVWTGIEYAAAGAMVYEGLIEQARQIVRTARSRYDGKRRNGLDSGPGGNPYNELECGKFYARAMSSWSLLIASQGQVLDGPTGLMGFKPRWQPEDHRSFYTAPEGWGLFVQSRRTEGQTERIEVRHGKLSVKELVFELPAGAGAAATATVTAAGQAAAATVKREGAEVRLTFAQPLALAEGQAIEVAMKW